MIGQKKFQLDKNDAQIYALVISSMIRQEIIEKQLLDRYEISKILSETIDFYLGMRIPDLEYIALNSFEDL